jgi:Glycosyl hydrolase family 76
MCAASLAQGSKIAIDGMLTYYAGDVKGATPGIFNEVQNYYWWMAGAAWNVFYLEGLPTDIRQLFSTGG